MPNIPNFNNGDLMKSIRENSLNPAIDKINALDTKVSTLETDSDKSFTDVSTTPDGKIEFTLGDNSKKQITVNPDDSRLDTTTLKNNEIVSWNTADQKFKPTGVLASLGEVTVAPGTILFGNHRMSSSNENVVFSNEDSGKNYTPVWQEQAPGSSEAYMRVIQQTSKVTRIPVGNVDVTNPANIGVTVNADETFFGGKFTLSQPATDVIMEIYDQSGRMIWEDQLGNLSAGDHDVVFEVPFDIRKGFIYDVYLKARGGNKTIVAKGPGTKKEFSWEVTRALWTDEQVATKAWVTANAGGSGADLSDLSNGMLPYYDSADGKLKNTNLESVSGTVKIPATGFYVGDAKITADGHEITYKTGSSPVASKLIKQTIVEGSDVVLIKSFSTKEDSTPQSSKTSTITNPSTTLTPGKNASLSSIEIHPAKNITNVKVTISQGGGVIYQDTFYNLAAGADRTLEFLTPPDLLSSLQYTVSFEGSSSDGSDYVYLLGANRAPYVKYNIIPWIEEKVATQQYVNGLLFGISNKVKNDLAQVATNKADIAKANTLITNLGNKLKSKTKNFVYRGSTTPTFPKGSRNDYFLTFYGLAGNVQMTTPDGGTIGDGTLLIIENEDSTYNIGVTASTGKTVDNHSTIVLLPHTVNAFVFNSATNDWDKMFSGYLPASYKSLYSQVKNDLLADKKFLTNIKVQGDDPAAVLDCHSLEFKGATVQADPLDAFNGIIDFAGGSGSGTDFSELSDGDIPYFDQGEGKFKDSGVGVSSSGVQVPARGLSLGKTRIAADGQGFTYNPSISKMPRKLLSQEINQQSSDLLIKSYGSVETLKPQPQKTAALTNPSIDFTPTKSAALGGIKIQPAKNIKNVTVTITQGRTIIFEDVFYTLKSGGERPLKLNAVPDLLKGVTYTISFKGTSDDGSATIGLLGYGQDPYIEYNTLPWTEEKVATQTYVDNKQSLAGGEITFINPDASVHKGNTIKLVGLEIKDPGNGSPLKLYALNHQNLPKPAESDAYAFYDASPTAPDTLAFPSLPLFRGGRVTIHKDVPDAQYAYIILPPGQVEPTEKIGELGGLPAYWTKESKNYPVNGVSREYTVFRSPYPFHETDITFILYP